MSRIKGISAALLTPFNQNGELDFKSLEEHCDFLIEKGINSLYILGTTGESFLMSIEERQRFARKVIDYVSDRIPVFMHIGDIPTKNAINMLDFAKTINIGAVGAITPFYYGMNQDELYTYYYDLSKAAGDQLDIYLYNLPGCTTNDLLPETIVRLAELENIVGIKNSMDDMVRLCNLIDQTPADFDVIQGSDILLSSGLLYGAAGSVSGNSNVFPEFFVQLYDAYLEKDLEEIKRVQKIISETAAILKNGSNLAYFKRALEIRGLRPSYNRKPIKDLNRKEFIELEKNIKNIENKYL
jgi:4-hydroxy-tetrahydrodipicolinate synthase